jgi:hypothetical protein
MHVRTLFSELRPFRPTRWLLLSMVASLFTLPCSAGKNDNVDSVTTLAITRSPVGSYTGTLQQNFILTNPATAGITPTPVVILLPGGDGNIHLYPLNSTVVLQDGSGPFPNGSLHINSSNFLVRSRWYFASRGFVTITLDAATDFKASSTGLTGQQGSTAHVTDVLQVIAWARTNYPGLPVWVIGTSRGPAGAFVAAAYSPTAGGPDGLVFTSPLNTSTTDPDSLANTATLTLSAIGVPTLLVGDVNDTCAASNPLSNATIAASLTGVPTVDVGVLTVGSLTMVVDPPLTGPCNALSYHGFFGIEASTVNSIGQWILLH